MERVPNIAMLKEIEIDILQVKNLITVTVNYEWLIEEAPLFLQELGSKVVMYADLPGQEFKEQLDSKVIKIVGMRGQQEYYDTSEYVGNALDYVLNVIRGYLKEPNTS